MDQSNFISQRGIDHQLIPFTGICASTSIRSVCFNVDVFDDSLFSRYSIQKPNRYPYWVNKRKAEFLAGRIVATQALKDIGFDKSSVAIGLNGAPMWPPGVNGSISHSRNVAVAIATTENCLVGIDIEPIFEVENAVSIFLNEQEHFLIRQRYAQKKDRLRLYTAVFSAKECIFKAIHPVIKQYVDFSFAELIDINAKHLRFSLKVGGVHRHVDDIKLPNQLSVYYRAMKIRGEYESMVTILKHFIGDSIVLSNSDTRI